jgi:hypothetical protein
MTGALAHPPASPAALAKPDADLGQRVTESPAPMPPPPPASALEAAGNQEPLPLRNEASTHPIKTMPPAPTSDFRHYSGGKVVTLTKPSGRAKSAPISSVKIIVED